MELLGEPDPKASRGRLAQWERLAQQVHKAQPEQPDQQDQRDLKDQLGQQARPARKGRKANQGNPVVLPLVLHCRPAVNIHS